MRNVLPSLHVGLQEGLVRLLSRDPRKRPTAQLLSSIKYFRYFLYSLLIPFHAIAVKCLSSAFSRRITSSVCRDCSSSRRLLSAKRYHHSIIIYFSLWDYEPLSDAAVHALQFLDVINMKDPGQKSQFYRTTLKDMLPCIPKVFNYILSLNLYVP